MTQEPRPHIDAAKKRRIRKRCGFGWVICGSPFYDIDHIVDYADDPIHDEDNLTLLCPNHHRGKTPARRRISLETVRRYNADPHNRRYGTTAPELLFFESGMPSIEAGTNVFTSPTDELIALAIDNLPVLRFRRESGVLLLTVLLMSAADEPVLIIDANQLVISVEPWDIETIANTVTIRSGPRRFIVQLEFMPPDSVRVTRGLFYHNGALVDIRPAGITVNGRAGVAVKRGVYKVPVGYAVGESDAFPWVAIRLRGVERMPLKPD
jgi:HNH endonuclease